MTYTIKKINQQINIASPKKIINKVTLTDVPFYKTNITFSESEFSNVL